MSLVDMRIDVDDFVPRVSLGHRRSSSMPCLVDGCYGSGGFSYTKLPDESLRLTVLKLDGSSFDIEVTKLATVAELRQAVEAAFSHIPRKGIGEISWPHVWGHFCLSYDGQKLVAETDYIRHYGIRDGDQLQFVRHISTNYSPRRKHSMKWGIALGQHRISLSQSNSHEEKEQRNEEDDYDIETGSYQYHDEKDDDDAIENESRWPHFLQQCFPYSRLPTMAKVTGLKASPSLSACRFLQGFKRILQICGDNHYSLQDALRDD